MTFSFFLLAACVVLFKRLLTWIDEPRALVNLFREQDFFWFDLLCGLAVLSKGPLGVVLPWVVVAGGALSLFGIGETLKCLLRPRCVDYFHCSGVSLVCRRCVPRK